VPTRSRTKSALADRRDPPQPQHGLVRLARGRQLHFELRHPVVVQRGVDQYLLHAPRAPVLGRLDVRVPDVTRLGIEADPFVVDAVVVKC
jgi:hypothetical protein